MKKNTPAFIMILCVCCHAAVFSQVDTKKIAAGLDNFTSELIKTAPNTVSHQNMWADAYIGQLLSVPPHLGGGVSAGAAALDFSGMKDALDAIGGDLGSALPETLFLPTLTADFRLGGILIPFDIGLHGMIIPSDVSFDKFSVNYRTFGGDIRFPILKQNVILPNLSIGAGFAYSAGNISVTEKNSNYGAEIEAGYKACIFQASLQLSKEFLFITPFVGVRGTITGAKQNYKVEYSYDVATFSKKEKEERSDGDWSWDNYTAQLYAGVGLDVLFIGQITANASYDVVNNIWAGGLSLRVKL
ncbi:MAG: hypothetical protein NC041_08390 [Bacteroides sp.]|nr:hypothetical protein [Prevotella sp.]MCM1408298.1 hypothetical protein [Treponema brennaborense]MCM1470470.1 hypothetical protein [Bacteroides sp.]